MKPQLLIAAPGSGAGKTTVTLGLLRALRERGMRVQPFKCGPDYIDPKYHAHAAGCSSINLDGYMMPAAHVKEVYARYTAAADVTVMEGVMGLFDGAHNMEGSSAALAALLQIPVILVVDASAMAYSAAALLYGYRHFYPAIRVAGVIFNHVDHPSHYRILEAAAQDAGVLPLGYLPANPAVRIPLRHLGLQLPEEQDAETIIAATAEHVRKHIDLDALLQNVLQESPAVAPVSAGSRGKLRIAVAIDAAFHFTYAENMRALSTLGTISTFSPLHDSHLPPADLLYLPGGYPELHLATLASNRKMLEEIRNFPGYILAECGGMMYLGKHILDEHGRAHEMAGLLDISTSMEQSRLSIGYREVCINDIVLKGHEFHYSRFTGTPAGTPTAVVYNALGEPVPSPVFYTGRLLAGYLHFYFGDDVTRIKRLFSL